MKSIETLKQALCLAGDCRRRLFAMIGLGFLAALSEGVGISLFFPLFHAASEGTSDLGSGRLSKVMNVVLPTGEATERLVVICMLIFAAVLIKNLLQYGTRVLSVWTDVRLLRTFRSRVMSNYLTAPFARFQRTEAGVLLNTIENETWKTSAAILAMVQCAIHLLTIGVFFAILLFISWRMTVIVSIALVLISAFIYLITRRVEGMARTVVHADESFAQRVMEIILGMKTIRVFSLERAQASAFEQASSAVSRSYLRKLALDGVIHPVSELLVAGLLVGILFLSTRGEVDFAAILTFVFILYRIHPQVKQLDHARTDVEAALPSVENVLCCLGADVAPDDSSLRRRPSHAASAGRGMVRFEHVSFAYDEGEPRVIDNMDLMIEPGSMTAIVGSSGAGKSTLVHLLAGLYEPTSGRIMVDGDPVGCGWDDPVRRRVAIVSHDAYLFDTTIYENILCGRFDASRGAVVEAARLAEAHDFIAALPQGYDTRVADMGRSLSTGQRQRIALARALLRNPSVLVLDEATNGLDEVSDTMIHRSLRTLRKGRTILLVAHRLSTIRSADHIVVVSAGGIVESGSLDELSSRRSLFAHLFELDSAPTADEVRTHAA